MEVQIKRTVKAGNSSAVVLPKAWLNKEVRIELVKKTPLVILNEIIEILSDKISLEDVIGVYLVGSYARGEETAESDIDVLVLTEKGESETIESGIYSIMIISSKLLKYKLENDLLPVGLMIREARSLLNSSYLKEIDVKVTKKNVRWYIETTDEKLKLVRMSLDKLKDYRAVPAELVYTLVLRIRTINTIKKMIRNKNYTKRELVSLIERVSHGKSAYECYSAVKNNNGLKKEITIEEAERLYDYLKKELNIVRKIMK